MPACPPPSLSVEVPDSWEISREHGVTNVEARAVDLMVAGVRRDFLPPAAVLAFARRGQYGVRIKQGRDPFGAGASDLDVVRRQPDLFAVGA